MNVKDCRAVRREIDSSELSQRLSEQVETHVAACPACAQFRTERRELRELVGSLQPVVAPADFDVRLRARIARERDTQARQPFIFRFALTTPAIAVAALLVMLVGTIVWINQRNRSADPATASAGQNKETANPATPATVKNADKNQVEVATVDQSESQKRQNSTGRNPKSSPAVNTAAQALDFSTRGARSIPMRLDREGEVSLTAPSQPMVVTVQDANGATHKILLPPISFGSQRFDNRTPVSMTNRRDW
ncbi:MAG: hypothetical protein ACXW3C_09995 [Pyrinomonadaceae bacterium]